MKVQWNRSRGSLCSIDNIVRLFYQRNSDSDSTEALARILGMQLEVTAYSKHIELRHFQAGPSIACTEYPRPESKATTWFNWTRTVPMEREVR